MRLKAVILQNFRAFRERTRVYIGDLTALIGRNDVGKSTVLEALEIFFNNKAIKMEPADSSRPGDSDEVLIGCVFDDLPGQVVIDATHPTTLAAEHLTNEDGDLEIHQVWNCGAKTPTHTVYAWARHPTAEGYDSLLALSRTDLRARLKEPEVDDTDVPQNANAPMRQAIWASAPDLALASVRVPLAKGDAKNTWEQLQKSLPVYALFRADRPNRDDDAEVTDPLDAAVRQAVETVRDELDRIKEAVQKQALKVATATVDKLKELDRDAAEGLYPDFREEPKWDRIFKLTLTGEDDIPMNKRGSGIRRLLLLSFFRAEAERVREDQQRPNVIYAVEEPETSQHPQNQRLIIESLMQLADRDGCQVLITTHVPGLAGYLPTGAVRYVKATPGGAVEVDPASEDVYGLIAEELGVVPDNRVEVLVCVEGPNDVHFLHHISRMLHGHNAHLPDLDADPRVVCIPMGGGNLCHWVQNHYLRPLGRREVHIYDRDSQGTPKYQDYMNEVNARTDGSWAVSTSKRELENYLHQDALTDAFGVAVPVTDTLDVPHTVRALLNCNEGQAKRRLNDDAARHMTPARLHQRDPSGEVEGWLHRIGGMLTGPLP